MRLFRVIIIVVPLNEMWCSLLVHPEDAIARAGNNVSFSCRTNSSDGVSWMYTRERNNFQDLIFIYSEGELFHGWRERHQVTESANGYCTLTINQLIPGDNGFYTCMDAGDDSIATAALNVTDYYYFHGHGIAENSTTLFPFAEIENSKGYGETATFQYRTHHEEVQTIYSPLILGTAVSAIIVIAFILTCVFVRKRKLQAKSKVSNDDVGQHQNPVPCLETTVALLNQQTACNYEEILDLQKPPLELVKEQPDPLYEKLSKSDTEQASTYVSLQ